jgi:hypothetical protein
MEGGLADQKRDSDSKVGNVNNVESVSLLPLTFLQAVIIPDKALAICLTADQFILIQQSRKEAYCIYVSRIRVAD